MSLAGKTEKKRILLICPHPVGYAPGQRLRYEQYLGIIEQNGYDVTVSAFMSETFQKMVYEKGHYPEKVFWTVAGYFKRIRDLFRIRRYDIVYVFLWVTPFGPPFFEKLVRGLSKKLIYDIDDMIFSKESKSKANPIISGLKGKNKPVYLFKKADHVLTSTSAIEQFARNLNKNVTNVPVTINTDSYLPKAEYNNGKIILGWSGSLSTSPYLHLLDNMLLKLREKYDFKLLVMGDENFKIPGLEVEAIPWKEEYETSVIGKFDIGLYPLPDNNWVHGKGGGKALQYMAAGVPAVATAIATNLTIIEDGVSGFLVSGQEEWIEKLSLLIATPDMRRQIGKNGRERVEKYYSVQANAHIYLDILRETITKN